MRPFLLLLALPATLLSDGPELIEKRCLSCHNAAAKMGGLNLETRDSAQSVLPAKLGQRVAAGQMPPGGGLAPAEREQIAAWLASGAPWDRKLSPPRRQKAGENWWSLQPLRRAEPPPSADHRGAIDRFLLAKLREKNLQPAPEADKATLLRRLTFDLTGLPPAPPEIAAFLADSTPGAYERLVDRLLASPAYGERWGRHWLDVARYGDSHGYEQNHLRPNAWPYRDYVINALNRDIPFNQFILEQLAGDVAGKGNPEIEAATAFLVAGPHDTVGNQAEAARRQQRADDLDDIVNATASAFLGLSVNCARCHDHKFDPILQADYYRFAAVFNGVVHGEREIASPERRAAIEAQRKPLEQAIAAAKEELAALAKGGEADRPAAEARLRSRHREAVTPFETSESFAPRQAKFIRLAAPNGIPGGLDEIEAFDASGVNLAQAAAITVSSTRVADGIPGAYHARHLNDGKFDQRWFPAPGGPAWIRIELAQPAKLAKAVWSTDRKKGFQGRFQQAALAAYALEVSLDGATWHKVASGDDRLPARKEDFDRAVTLEALQEPARIQYLAIESKLKKLEADLRAAPKLPTVYAGQMKQPTEPVYLLNGGNVMNRGPEVAPGALAVLNGFQLPPDTPEAERRLRFAQWLGDPANPLTPRVIVNRLWHHHFGRGIVGTPSDFGFNGERPTHPELLDYLAARLIEYGWRLKPLHKEIVLSAAYRQSSRFDASAARADAESRLLWRYPPRRLEAEAIRDAMLAAAGVLNPKMGGPGFQLFKYTVDNVATYFPVDKLGPETYRRGVYAQQARSIRNELLSVFDCPDPSLPEPRRVVTTSPLQALSLLNHSFTIDMAEALAARLQREAPTDPQRAELAFLLTFGRNPDETEKQATLRLAATHGWPAAARALFNANEFVYVH